jgi:large subunit ribosomal protein L4
MADVSAPVLGGGSVQLDADCFTARFNMPLVHETVRAELNARRRGTASTKTRGEVSGGGAKPWRQKGTGRARAGSSRSPVWTGGGTVFGPTPRSYTVKVNRKARRAALRSALSAHASRGSMAVFSAGGFEEPSTQQAFGLLEDWGADAPFLVLLSESEAAAGKSFRNIARCAVMPVTDAGVADVIGAASLLVSEAAMAGLVALAGGAAVGSAPVAAAPEVAPEPVAEVAEQEPVAEVAEEEPVAEAVEENPAAEEAEPESESESDPDSEPVEDAEPAEDED